MLASASIASYSVFINVVVNSTPFICKIHKEFAFKQEIVN